MITDIRNWLRTDDHSLGVVMLVLGLLLVTTTLTMVFGGA